MHTFFRSLLLFLCLLPYAVSAQLFDSLQLSVGTNATVATQNYQPLWLVSNRFGTITDQQADISTHLRVANRHILGINRQLYRYLRENENLPELGIAYGADLYVNNHFGSVYLQEAYIKMNLNQWQIRAGRYEEVHGEINPELSSGSFGISKNALPIPKISLVISEYTDIPFTDSFLQFKGKISHGWMRGGYVEETFMHDKNLYIRGGRRNFGIYGGLNHYVVWGGRHPIYGPFPQGFNVFWNSAFSQIRDMENLYEMDSAKNLGNHLGFVDFGLDAYIKGLKITIYNQVPFENGNEIHPFSDNNRMVGISVVNTTSKSFLSAVTFEYISTHHVSNNGSVVSFQNYYNNPFYQTGWSYLGNVIGTPLFFNQTRANRYFNNTISGYQGNIVSNRIQGMHLGISGRLPADFNFRTLLTVTRNYGNAYNSSDFYPGLMQTYFMQEITYRYQSWKVGATLGADFGEMSNNFGLMLALEYHLGQQAAPGTQPARKRF